MNLPNFINFEPFNLLRHRMRTIKLGDFDLDRFRRKHGVVHVSKPAPRMESATPLPKATPDSAAPRTPAPTGGVNGMGSRVAAVKKRRA
jgi:hypothetical protein